MREIWAVIKETISEFRQDHAMRLAAALAFWSALSLAPLLVVVLSVTDLFWGSAQAQAEIVRQATHLVGDQGAAVVGAVLRSTSRTGKGGLAAAIGLVALLFGATGAFAQLQDALNTMWHVEAKPGRDVRQFLRKRLLSLGMVLGVGLLLLASLAASSVLNLMVVRLHRAVAGPDWIWQALSSAGSVLLFAFLFAALYKGLPDVEISWRDVAIGALVTSVLFVIGKELIGMYLGRATFGSTYGAAGSLVVLLAWIYYSSLAVFLGAEFTQVEARRYGKTIRPNKHARAVPDRHGPPLHPQPQ